MKDTLTLLQRRFVIEYLKDGNGVRALRRAGSKGNANTLGVQASRYLKMPKVQQALAEEAQRLAENEGTTLEAWLEEAKRLREEARDAKHYQAAVKMHETIARCLGYLQPRPKEEKPASLWELLQQIQVNVRVENTPEAPSVPEIEDE